jgi:hypothetical protein
MSIYISSKAFIICGELWNNDVYSASDGSSSPILSYASKSESKESANVLAVLALC